MASAVPSHAFRVASRFIPTIETPETAILPLHGASVGLLLACFSLTYQNKLATSLRVLLFVPIAYLCYDVAYGAHFCGSRATSMGLTLMGLVGIMRAFDICLVSLLDAEPPYWAEQGNRLPLPTSLGGRFMYALDMLSTVRGTSWYPGISWDWAPKYISAWVPPPISRISYIAQNLAWLSFNYLLLDIFDTINHTIKWDPSNPHSVTTLSVTQQLVFSFSVCFCTYLCIEVPSLIYSTLFVSLGSSPAAWPPIFNRPYHATSLQDFWTHRWHHIFRRVFERVSLPVIAIIPHSIPLGVRRVFRAVLVFGLSAAFHLVLIERMLVAPLPYKLNLPKDVVLREVELINPSTLKFFLLQPLGLLIERALIVPLTNPLPSNIRVALHRLWAWGWLLWSGRFWADAWVQGGMWGEDEGLVGWSIVRGILYGQWWTV